MIVAEQKPLEEIKTLVANAQKVLVVGLRHLRDGVLCGRRA